MRTKIYGRGSEDYYTEKKIKRKEKVYRNQREGYSKSRSQILFSKLSVNFFFDKFKENFGEKKALNYLSRILEKISDYKLMKVRVSEETFPYHLMVTNKALILALVEEKEDKRTLLGTYVHGGEFVRKYPKIFDIKFTEATPIEEYAEEIKKRIQK